MKQRGRRGRVRPVYPVSTVAAHCAVTLGAFLVIAAETLHRKFVILLLAQEGDASYLVQQSCRNQPLPIRLVFFDYLIFSELSLGQGAYAKAITTKSSRGNGCKKCTRVSLALGVGALDYGWRTCKKLASRCSHSHSAFRTDRAECGVRTANRVHSKEPLHPVRRRLTPFFLSAVARFGA